MLKKLQSGWQDYPYMCVVLAYCMASKCLITVRHCFVNVYAYNIMVLNLEDF